MGQHLSRRRRRVDDAPPTGTTDIISEATAKVSAAEDNSTKDSLRNKESESRKVLSERCPNKMVNQGMLFKQTI